MSLLSRRGVLRPPVAGHDWTFDHRVSGPSGRAIAVPSGFRISFWDDFNYTSVTQLEDATYLGGDVWAAYSGQDGAYASGFWHPSHLEFPGSQVVLAGRFDTAVHATKYVTGGLAAYYLAAAGHVPAGSMWTWCAREEPAAGAKVKAVAMTYGSTWPDAGAYGKYDSAGSNVGNGFAEWPYCGEDDHRESDQGSGSSTTTWHWHDPSLLAYPGNRNGHRQLQVGSLALDHSQWHIYAKRIDLDGTYRGFTNDAAAADQPLREWITQPGAPGAFRQPGNRFIYQQEAYEQPPGGTTARRVYLDWVALLEPA